MRPHGKSRNVNDLARSTNYAGQEIDDDIGFVMSQQAEDQKPKAKGAAGLNKPNLTIQAGQADVDNVTQPPLSLVSQLGATGQQAPKPRTRNFDKFKTTTADGNINGGDSLEFEGGR